MLVDVSKHWSLGLALGPSYSKLHSWKVLLCH